MTRRYLMKPLRRILPLILAISLIFGNLAVVPAAEDEGVTIYLIRHGKTLFNTLSKVQGFIDSPLTDVGIAGAQDTGMGLSDVKFDAAFSSDRGRAAETASIILSLNAKTGDIPLTQLMDLREINYGKYEGDPNMALWGGVAKQLGAADMNELYTHPLKEIMDTAASLDETGAMETFDESMSRILRGLEIVATSRDSGNVLCVAHGNVIGNIVSALGGSLAGEVPNASVTILKYKDGKYELGKVADESENEAGKAKREANGGTPVYPEGKAQSTEAPQAGDGKVTLYVVRHGRTTLNEAGRMQGIADAPLTEAGVMGAINTGLGLKDVKFDGIYSSDLGRTIETINLLLSVNSATDASVSRTQLKDFREYNFGIYEGDPQESVYPILFKAGGVSSLEDMVEKGVSIFDLYDAVSKDPETLVESASSFRERVSAGFKRVTAEMSSKGTEATALVVIHGLVMGALLEELGVAMTAEIPNAAVVKVIYENGEFSIDADNIIDLSYNTEGAKLNPLKSEAPGVLDGLSPKTITVNGKPVVAYEKDGLYASVRDLSEAVGASVSWDNASQSAIVVYHGKRLALKANTNQYYVGETIHFIDGALSTVNASGEQKDRSFAPADLILGALGIKHQIFGDAIELE
jgi:broad specificity phosphatase PhoE